MGLSTIKVVTGPSEITGGERQEKKEEERGPETKRGKKGSLHMYRTIYRGLRRVRTRMEFSNIFLLYSLWLLCAR